MKYQTLRQPDPATYFAVFENTDHGQRILAELKGLFFDRASFDPSNQYMTAYNEGQRAVIEFILRKTLEGEKGEDSTQTFEANQKENN